MRSTNKKLVCLAASCLGGSTEMEVEERFWDFRHLSPYRVVLFKLTLWNFTLHILYFNIVTNHFASSLISLRLPSLALLRNGIHNGLTTVSRRTHPCASECNYSPLRGWGEEPFLGKGRGRSFWLQSYNIFRSSPIVVPDVRCVCPRFRNKPWQVANATRRIKCS